MSTALPTCVAVAVLALAGCAGSAAGVPRIASPLPFVTTLPMSVFWAAVREAPELRWVLEFVVPALIGPALLFAWHPKLLKRAENVPRRSLIGLPMLSALTIMWFLSGWQYGLKYQTRAYVISVALFNAAALMVAWGLLAFARKRRSFKTTLLMHSFVVAWLVWIAFPWLGELP
jgi:uncharacterized membrane protein YtjA (UPF0391 family)